MLHLQPRQKAREELVSAKWYFFPPRRCQKPFRKISLTAVFIYARISCSVVASAVVCLSENSTAPGIVREIPPTRLTPQGSVSTLETSLIHDSQKYASCWVCTRLRNYRTFRSTPYQRPSPCVRRIRYISL